MDCDTRLRTREDEIELSPLQNQRISRQPETALDNSLVPSTGTIVVTSWSGIAARAKLATTAALSSEKQARPHRWRKWRSGRRRSCGGPVPIFRGLIGRNGQQQAGDGECCRAKKQQHGDGARPERAGGGGDLDERHGLTSGDVAPELAKLQTRRVCRLLWARNRAGNQKNRAGPCVGALHERGLAVSAASKTGGGAVRPSAARG